MWSNSKRIELTIAGLVALAAYAPDATAQLQGPGQGLPQVQSEGTKPSPMRDFEQMIEAQRSQMHSRVTEAAERVQNACRTELQKFCATVTPGEGRLLLCMQAHEDKLGNQCELALLRLRATFGRPCAASSVLLTRVGPIYRRSAWAAVPSPSA